MKNVSKFLGFGTLKILKCLDNKWAVRLHSDSLKMCNLTVEQRLVESGFHSKQTHATSAIPFGYILLVV